MIRARRLLEAARRSQQLALANGSSSSVGSVGSSSGARALSLATPPPSRFTHGLLQRRWLSSSNSGPQEAAPMSPAAAEELRAFLHELAGCRDSGNWRQALKLLDRIDRQGYALDPHMYERAIGACARMGKVEVLPGMLQNMQVDNILPTSATVDYIVQAYLAREEWKLIAELAMDVTAKGVPLSDAAFQAAMEACGQARDAVSARRVITNMWKHCGLQASTDQFAAAIRAAGMSGRPDIALGLFSRMEEKAGLTADEDVFTQLIRAQIVSKALPQALQAFATVSSRGVQLREPIYTATIDALVKNGDHWHAGRLFEQMLELELSPSVFCYGRVMVAYVRTGKNNRAAACWRKVVAADEPAPALKKYAQLMQELSMTSDSKLTLAVFDYVHAKFAHYVIRDNSYAQAIRANGRLGRTQAAVDIFDTLVASRDASERPLPRLAGIYIAVFNALSRDTERDPALNTRDAKRVWDVMVQNVPVILPPAYSSLAGVFAASGELDTLGEVLELAGQNFSQLQLQRAAGGVDESDLALLSGDEDEDDETAALLDQHADEVNDVDDASDLHDELLYNGVISGFSKAREDHSVHIASYLKLMKARGLKINDSIVRASTDAFIKFENWALMTTLVDYVDVARLKNAEMCFGDSISKLLDAEAWDTARYWIVAAHKRGLQPPIRGKIEALRKLRDAGAGEWRIAYALALETLSFKQMPPLIVESVADAVDVCMNANRSDLVVKLFDRLASHGSHRGGASSVVIPLRMYKQTVLALLREPSADAAVFEHQIRKAERVCGQMLQLHSQELDGDALSMAVSIKATVGDDDDVMALFETMERLGATPNSYAQNAAIIAFSRARRVDKVLAIRDALVAQCAQDAAFVPDQNVAKSLLFSLAISHLDDALVATAAAFPNCSREHAVAALLQANRVERAVEVFDETVSSALCGSLLKRICDAKPGHRDHDPLTAAALLLKYVRFHGLARVEPANRVTKVAKALVAYGHLAEAAHILGLYADPAGDVLLKATKPAFQQEVMELLLVVYGEQRQFALLGQLFERPMLAFPLHTRHYQTAMSYAARAQDAAGAAQCLKLFESLRQQFVKPNGAVYVSALRSCRTLKLLESTGARVLEDARAQGFERMVSAQLESLAAKALTERKNAPPKPRGASLRRAAEEAAFEVDVDELAQLALFCHHHGLEVTPTLAESLVALQAHLPKNAAAEIAFIAQRYEDEQEEEEAIDATQARRTSSSATGARWGSDLILQPLGSSSRTRSSDE